MKGSPRPVTVGEVGQDEATTQRPIKHGTFNGYTNRACRCSACRKANSEHQRKRSGQDRITSEEAKYCQVCGVKLSDHPFVACWRKLLR